MWRTSRKAQEGGVTVESIDDVILRMSTSSKIYSKKLFSEWELCFLKLGQSRSIPAPLCLTESRQQTSAGNVDNLVITGHVLSLCLKPMPRWPILRISTKNKVTSFSKVLSTSCSHCAHKPHYRFLFWNSCPQKNFEATEWLYVLLLAICLFILVQI